MNTVSKRQTRIILALKNSTKRLSSEYLSKIIGISNKTIQKDILEMQDELQRNGATIDSKTGNGYYLIVHDPKAFDLFMSIFVDGSQEKRLNLPLHYQRAHYMIRRFIAANDYLKINDFSDELFISRAIITQEMNLVRKLLERFNLMIVSKTKYGSKIVGPEHCIRNCFIYESQFYEDNSLNLDEEEYASYIDPSVSFGNTVEEIIIKTLNRFSNLEIAYRNILLLVKAIYLISNRKDTPLQPFDETDKDELKKSDSYMACAIIAMECERSLQIRFSDDDLAYLNILMNGYRNITSYGNLQSHSFYFRYYDYVTEIVNYLGGINGFDNISKDTLLIDSLTRHFISMMVRVKYHIGIHCDDLSMKRMTTTSVEMAAQVAEYLKQHSGILLNEDELMFMVYIFSPVFGRYLPKISKKRIIIISHVSINVGNMIAERFERNFCGYLESIDVIDLYQLKDMDLSQYDFIFTTLDKKYFSSDIPIPVIEIQTYFPESKKQFFRNLFSNTTESFLMMQKLFKKKCFFTGIDVKSKEELFEVISEKLHQVCELDEQFKEDLITRDQWISAELGKNIARIKTLRSHGKQSFVSMFILERPILWDTEMIQIFQVWHHGTDGEFNLYVESGYVGNVLKTMFGFGDCAVQLLRNPTYDCFIGLLEEVVKEIKSLQLR